MNGRPAESDATCMALLKEFIQHDFYRVFIYRVGVEGGI